MKIWMLNIDTESGDHYYGLCSWFHKPTDEEVWRKVMELLPEGVEWSSEEDYGPEPFTVDGVNYWSCAYPNVEPMDLPETLQLLIGDVLDAADKEESMRADLVSAWAKRLRDDQGT